MLHNRILLIGLMLLGGWLSAQKARAQVIWGGEAERYFRPGAYTPFDGQSITQRYGYETGMPFLFPYSGSVSGRQLNYLDYADKLDRAYKFGYCPPPDPYHNAPPAAAPAPRFGFGLGIFSRRW